VQLPDLFIPRDDVRGASLFGRGQWASALKRTADCLVAAIIEEKCNHCQAPGKLA